LTLAFGRHVPKSVWSLLVVLFAAALIGAVLGLANRRGPHSWKTSIMLGQRMRGLPDSWIVFHAWPCSSAQAGFVPQILVGPGGVLALEPDIGPGSIIFYLRHPLSLTRGAEAALARRARAALASAKLVHDALCAAGLPGVPVAPVVVWLYRVPARYHVPMQLDSGVTLTDTRALLEQAGSSQSDSLAPDDVRIVASALFARMPYSRRRMYADLAASFDGTAVQEPSLSSERGRVAERSSKLLGIVALGSICFAAAIFTVLLGTPLLSTVVPTARGVFARPLTGVELDRRLETIDSADRYVIRFRGGEVYARDGDSYRSPGRIYSAKTRVFYDTVSRTYRTVSPAEARGEREPPPIPTDWCTDGIPGWREVETDYWVRPRIPWPADQVWFNAQGLPVQVSTIRFGPDFKVWSEDEQVEVVATGDIPDSWFVPEDPGGYAAADSRQ
jgi:hypothetical protein